MTDFPSNIITIYHQAAKHACIGSVDKSRELLSLLESIDRQGEVSSGRIAAVNALIALRHHDSKSAVGFANEALQDSVARVDLSNMIMTVKDTDACHIVLIQNLLNHADTPAGNTTRRRSFAQRIAFLAAALAITSGVSYFTFTRVGSPLELSKASTSSSFVSSLDDGQMADAVGRVLIYLTILLEDGSEHQYPAFSGTAFAVSADGLMLTNRHIIEAGRKRKESMSNVVSWDILVVFGESKEDWFSARIEKSSMYQDLAVIRIKKTFTNPLQFSKSYQQGDEVYAWGFPKDAVDIANELATSVSRSRANLQEDWVNNSLGAFNVMATRGTISAIRDTKLGRMVQTDAIIHEGNSGGPLVTVSGKVVGIVTMKHSSAEGAGVAMGWESLVDELESFPEIPIP